ncbi:MAG: hypothetical protein AAGG45_01590 [Pseudomonadota bacterium]
MVGSLKEEVLLAIVALGPDVLTAEVHAAVSKARKEARGQGLSFAAVFNTINRLHEDKLLNAAPGPIHRGKPMKAFTVNADGLRALNEANHVRSALQTPAASSHGGFADV